MLFLNVFRAILFSVLVVYAQGSPIIQNTSGHEIIDGNCSNLSQNDQVYYDHVNLMAFPLFVRSETIKYYGDGLIYCVEALNQKNEETGGTSVITAGGVGHSYVTIELESFQSHGLEFYVWIYAKNATITHSARIQSLIDPDS